MTLNDLIDAERATLYAHARELAAALERLRKSAEEPGRNFAARRRRVLAISVAKRVLWNWRYHVTR